MGASAQLQLRFSLVKNFVPNGVVDAKAAYWILKASLWTDTAVIAQARAIQSNVFTRREPGHPTALDKLRLITANPTRPMVFQELYGQEMSHAHTQQIGAILFYGANNQTFLKQQGRDNHMAEQASILMAWESPDVERDNVKDPIHLPFRRPRDTCPDSKKYQILELPTKHLGQPSLSPSSFYKRTLLGLSFLVNREGVLPSELGKIDTLYIDNIELVAANGSVVIIDNFEQSRSLDHWTTEMHGLPRNWTGPKVIKLSITNDSASVGGHALKADIPGVALGNISIAWAWRTSLLPTVTGLDVREFPTLRLQWRIAKDGVFVRRNNANIFAVCTAPYIATQPYPAFALQGSSNQDYNARQGIGGSSGYPSPTNWSNAVVANPRFLGHTTRANVDNHGDDHYSESVVEGHMTAASSWRRQIILLSEGPLVIVDTFDVEPRAVNWTAGPLWHFNVEHAPVPLPSASHPSHPTGTSNHHHNVNTNASRSPSTSPSSSSSSSLSLQSASSPSPSLHSASSPSPASPPSASSPLSSTSSPPPPPSPLPPPLSSSSSSSSSSPPPPSSNDMISAVVSGFNLTDHHGGVTRGNYSLLVAMSTTNAANTNPSNTIEITQGFLTGKNVNPFCVYSRRKLPQTSGVKARFMTLLLPFNPDIVSARVLNSNVKLTCSDVDVASNTSTSDTPCVATFVLVDDVDDIDGSKDGRSIDGGTSQTATVTIGVGGDWSVLRT